MKILYSSSFNSDSIGFCLFAESSWRIQLCFILPNYNTLGKQYISKWKFSWKSFQCVIEMYILIISLCSCVRGDYLYNPKDPFMTHSDKNDRPLLWGIYNLHFRKHICGLTLLIWATISTCINFAGLGPNLDFIQKRWQRTMRSGIGMGRQGLKQWKRRSAYGYTHILLVPLGIFFK